MFIAFEGIDGSGKSMLSNFISARLQQEGYSVLHTRPETDSNSLHISTSQVMTAIKGITHNPSFANTLSLEAELFLYCAQIAQMTTEVIEPALLKGKIVISDRYFYSPYSYFHYGKGLSSSFLKPLLTYASHDRQPDMIVYTDISAQEAFRRKKQSGKPLGRKELLGPVFFEKVRQGFLTIALQDPERWIIIDTQHPNLSKASEEILQKIKERIPRH